ncbi:MAG TPA: S-adenosylmethionine:tRNA ribosyltransferase-isomerase [Thermoanaerobaculia bacterium]|nr:S-adenosylmethionine:tRNA ribosyltransferase-isomerase [Thermoanaerobaculia bacterium]
MRAASAPRVSPLRRRLLAVDASGGRFDDTSTADLVERFEPGDLLVLNDSATLPASFSATTARGGRLEVRLAEAPRDGEAAAVLFGEGGWRQATERRPPPPILPAGTPLRLGGGLDAEIASISPLSPRLVRMRFAPRGSALVSALYRLGKPIQYSYLSRELALADVQTPYAGRPWSVEPPSAGFPLTPDVLRSLRRRGVALAWLTHGAGLSSTGDAALDAALPLPERFDLPAGTVEAIGDARSRGARVVAAGTTVVRALEGAFALRGRLEPGEGTTSLVIGPGFVRRVVDGILTGVHEPRTSHHALLQAFASEPLLSRALAHAEEKGYLLHEFGDSCLVLAA